MNRRFFSAWLALAATGLLLAASGLAQTARPAAEPGKPPATSAQADEIDFQRARELFRRRQQGEKLTADEEAYLKRAMALRQAQSKGKPGAAGESGASAAERGFPGGQATTGLKPLTEMTAEDRYHGQDGGLYGGGQNVPPDGHRKAAMKAAARIQPLDADGKPAADGRIVLVSISMSNATQEFSTFKRIADADPAKSPRLTIVDCAQGGQAMAEWAPPQAQPWTVAERLIANARVTPAQVQVAWIKLANKGPHGELEAHGRKLQRDTLAVIQNAKARFPNLQIAYLSSRIYGGYSTGALNPEPFAYESAFPVRWLIQDQVRGAAALNFDSDRGDVKAPLLLWGPYLWADGTTPRTSDKLVYLREDLAGDGTHPSDSGRQKVARQLLDFFLTDETANGWFAKEG